MVFWLAILMGVLFVWLAVRMGFYEMWVLLFNIVVSVYVAVFLAPIVAEFAPGGDELSSYGTALSMIVLAGGCFAILQGLSYVFLTGQFSIPFPRVFDILFSGGLGFLAGFLILSFVALVLATTPLAERDIVRTLGLGSESQQANISCIAWCCNRVHSVASADNHENATEAAVQRLLKTSGRQRDKAESGIDPNALSAARRPQTQPPKRDTENITARPRSRTSRIPLVEWRPYSRFTEQQEGHAIHAKASKSHIAHQSDTDRQESQICCET